MEDRPTSFHSHSTSALSTVSEVDREEEDDGEGGGSSLRSILPPPLEEIEVINLDIESQHPRGSEGEYGDISGPDPLIPTPLASFATAPPRSTPALAPTTRNSVHTSAAAIGDRSHSIRHMSTASAASAPTVLENPDEHELMDDARMQANRRAFDDSVVHKAVVDAGKWAHGIVFVEVWRLSVDQTHLYRPDMGYWLDPVYQQVSNPATQELLLRLTDKTHPQYVPARNLAMGEGLAGLLWVESRNVYNNRNNNKKIIPGTVATTTSTPALFISPATSAALGGGGNVSGGEEDDVTGSRMRRGESIRTNVQGGGGKRDSNARIRQPQRSQSSPQVMFRNVNQISNDPDQPFSPRLQLISSIGLGWCAAVAIKKGIVLYFARNQVSLELMRSPSNQDYLVAAAQFISAAFELREPRQVAEQARKREIRSAWFRLHNRISYLKRMGVSFKDAVKQSEEERKKKEEDNEDAIEVSLLNPLDGQGPTCCPNLSHPCHGAVTTTKKLGRLVNTRVVAAFKKMRGGGGMLPPAASTFQSCYSGLGVFGTLAFLHFFLELMKYQLGTYIAIGPFGAVMTALFCLSSSPAAQPLNTMLSHLLCIPIGIGFSYASFMPVWLRVNCAAALAATTMSKLGILHPPAGGAAFTFASADGEGWRAMALSLIVNAVAIVAAMIVNNFSIERQYPVYWGFGPGTDSSDTIWWRIFPGRMGRWLRRHFIPWTMMAEKEKDDHHDDGHHNNSTNKYENDSVDWREHSKREPVINHQS